MASPSLPPSRGQRIHFTWLMVGFIFTSDFWLTLQSPIHIFSYIVTSCKRVSILPTIIGWPKESSSKMSRSAVRCDDIRPLSFRVELRSREGRAMKLKKFSLSLGFLSVEASPGRRDWGSISKLGDTHLHRHINWDLIIAAGFPGTKLPPRAGKGDQFGTQ